MSLFVMNIFIYSNDEFYAKYEEVYNAVYELEWYTLEMKDARNLIFLLIRMNKPLYITAGKILPMTMATFCSVRK